MIREQNQPSEDGDTRTAILKAAEQLFAGQSYHAVSVSAVAAEAGVSKANVFHHFGSKAKLYLAVLQRARRSFLLRLSKAGESADLRRELKELAYSYLSNLQENEGLFRLFMREMLDPECPAGPDLAPALFGESFAASVTLFAQGQADGRVRADIDPALLVMLLVSSNVLFVQARALLRQLPGFRYSDDPDAFVRGFTDILWAGVSARNDRPCPQPLTKED